MQSKKQSQEKKPTQDRKLGSNRDIWNYFTDADTLNAHVDGRSKDLVWIFSPSQQQLNKGNKQNSSFKNPSPKRKRSVSSTPPPSDSSNKRRRQSLSISNSPTEEEQEFTINLGDCGKEHVAKGRMNDSIYTALMALPDVRARQAKEKGKEMHLLGKRGIEGYVNLGMPLGCLPENSHFELKFYKMNRAQKAGEGYRQYESKGKKCIIFYVFPVGNIWKNNSRRYRILSCWQLAKDLNKLCVFAPKGETLKDALCKDGRFLSCLEQKEWHMMEGQLCRPSDHCVNKLANRSFEVVVKTKQPSKAGGCSGNEQSCVASDKGQGKTYNCIKSNILKLYPDLEKQRTVINEFFAKALKEGKSSSAVFKLYRENFGKETKNSTPIKVHKRLSDLSNSVGFIEWTNNRNGGSATCFVLCDKYILTCHHVVRDIVGEGVAEESWALIISKSARVTFSYEDKHPVGNGWFSLAPWFEIYNKDLDFAVLKLEESGGLLAPGLKTFSCPLPFNGLIYIIGHPDGQAKSVDGCTVVPVFERERECHFRTKRGQEEICNNVICGSGRCIHMFTQRSFQVVINNPNIVTYDTSFFSGSSGSPVFNADGQLVAMHAAGYKYEKNKKVHSIVEFGFSMAAILAAIKKKDEVWYGQNIETECRTFSE
uniref:Protein FAM111A n=1 Tax=Pelusios castaneus TaxID=367368 RepID=A0A8C8RFW5_9SAUR